MTRVIAFDVFEVVGPAADPDLHFVPIPNHEERVEPPIDFEGPAFRPLGAYEVGHFVTVHFERAALAITTEAYGDVLTLNSPMQFSRGHVFRQDSRECHTSAKAWLADVPVLECTLVVPTDAARRTSIGIG